MRESFPEKGCDGEADFIFDVAPFWWLAPEFLSSSPSSSPLDPHQRKGQETQCATSFGSCGRLKTNKPASSPAQTNNLPQNQSQCSLIFLVIFQTAWEPAQLSPESFRWVINLFIHTLSEHLAPPICLDIGIKFEWAVDYLFLQGNYKLGLGILGIWMWTLNRRVTDLLAVIIPSRPAKGTNWEEMSKQN